MNLKFLLILIIILCLCFLLTQLVAYNMRTLKQCVISWMLFIAQYYVFSIIFLWLDRFEVRHILIVIAGLDFIACFCWRKNIFSKIRHMHIVLPKKDLILIGVLILMVPFLFVKSEDIRSSSDMGMYFEWMIKLTGDNTEVSRTLNEIGIVSKDVDEGVYRIQEQLNGIYVRDELDNGEKIYEYHSLPTWVTMMALFAKLFGIYNAAQVLTLFYILAVLCCYFACENIGKISRSKYLSILIFGLSPIIMYIAKCTLTEIAYINLLLFSVYCLSEKDRKIKYLSSVGFGLLGFIHISSYMYIFAIYFILLYIAICKKKKEYGIINIINIIMFITSLFYANFISRFYTEAQLMRLYFLGNNLKEIMQWLLFILVGCIIIQIIELLLSENVLDKLIILLNRIVPAGLITLEIIIIIGCIIQGYYLGFTEKYISGGGTWHLRSEYANQGIHSLSYLNIVNILRATSYVWIPIIFIYNICRKNKKNIIENALLFGLFYSMFIYTYIQIDTPTNYYASRYLAMTIVPLVTLVSATIFDKKKIYVALSGWCLIYSLRYDYNFIFRGSFAGQYQMLKDTIAQIPYGAVVVVLDQNNSLNQILVNNLREINANLVYEYNNMDELETYYSDQPLFIISSGTLAEEEHLLLYKSYEITGNLSGKKGGYMTEEVYTYNETLCIYSTW